MSNTSEKNMSDSENILAEFTEQTGWSDSSQIALLCRFLDQEAEGDADTHERLSTFLAQQDEEENKMGWGESEEEFHPDEDD